MALFHIACIQSPVHALPSAAHKIIISMVVIAFWWHTSSSSTVQQSMSSSWGQTGQSKSIVRYEVMATVEIHPPCLIEQYSTSPEPLYCENFNVPLNCSPCQRVRIREERKGKAGYKSHVRQAAIIGNPISHWLYVALPLLLLFLFFGCCCCSSSSAFDQKSATYDHLSVEPRHISIAAERTEELLRVLSRASNRHGNPITSFSFNHQQQGQWSQEMSPMKLPPEMMMLLHQFASLIPLTLRICHVILGVSLLTLSHSPSLSPSATLFVDVLLFLALHSGRG